MKKWYCLFMLVLMLSPLAFASDDRPTGICGSCSWYRGENGQRGYFEKIWLELEEDQRTGFKSEETGQRYSRYQLGNLRVDVLAHLSCAKDVCPPDRKLLDSFKKYTKAIIKIIDSGRICSSEAKRDDFSSLIGK